MFVEFRDLEKLAGKPTEFLAAYVARISALNASQAIRLLKSTGICVDIFGNARNVPLFSACLETLHEKYAQEPSEPIERLIREVTYFNALFKLVTTARKQSGVEAISGDQKSIALLTLVERLFRKYEKTRGALFAKATVPTDPDFKTVYDRRFQTISLGNIDQATNIYETLVSDLSLILKYLKIVHRDEVENLVSEDSVTRSAPHLDIVQTFKVVNELHERWRFFDLVLELTGGVLEFRDSGSETICLAADSLRYLSLTRVDQLVASNALHGSKFDSKTNRIPPHGFKSEYELIASMQFANSIFLADVFTQSFYDIPVAEWVRTFTVLMRFSSEIVCDDAQVYVELTPQDFGALLLENGVPSTSLSRITEILTFDPRRSEDLFDSPLIRHKNGNVILFPVVCQYLNFSNAFLSNLQSRGVDLSGRGFRFEDELLTRFRAHGIMCSGLYKKYEQEQYECDCCIYLDRTIFFFEAKVFFEPRSVRSKYEHMEKVEDAISQLDRIAQFYMTNTELVIDQIGLSRSVQIDKFVKVVVTSTMYSGPSIVNGVYVSDFSSLARFISREPHGLVSTRKNSDNVLEQEEAFFEDYREIYEGEITSEKLLVALEKQPTVVYARAMTDMIPIEYPIGNLTLKYTLPQQTVPTTFGIVE